MTKVCLINGPNLNLLGSRETNIYGNKSLTFIEKECCKIAQDYKISLVSCFQSNCEGEIIDKIHQLYNQIDFIIINPAAYTHTSIGIRDAFLATEIPFIEVHLSNPVKREKFRHKSLLEDIALGKIMGFGYKSYFLAMKAIALEQLK